MPEYLFEKTEVPIPVIHTVFFHMNDEKVYNGPDGKEVGQWRRVWSSPRAATDMATIDPYSQSDFVRATNKQGTVGDLFDRSAELSAKRADKEGGRDPFKEGFYSKFQKKHGNKKHPQQIREEGVRALKERGINLDWGEG
jgi:hypothetical protein